MRGDAYQWFVRGTALALGAALAVAIVYAMVLSAKVLGLLDGWAQGSTDPQDRFFVAARGVALAGSGQIHEARQIADSARRIDEPARPRPVPQMDPAAGPPERRVGQQGEVAESQHGRGVADERDARCERGLRARRHEAPRTRRRPG